MGGGAPGVVDSVLGNCSQHVRAALDKPEYRKLFQDKSKEQRKALADLLGADDEHPLGDRLSVHARVLLTELAITLRDDTTPSAAAPSAAASATASASGSHVSSSRPTASVAEFTHACLPASR